MPIFDLLGGLSLLVWLYLTFLHGMFWKPLLPETKTLPQGLPSVDIIVPARNETAALTYALPSLLAQDYPGTWRIILVDDHSTDGTGELARKIAGDNYKSEYLKVISAPDLADGWSGKVAAMHTGVKQSTANMILFTDADIYHDPQSLSHLIASAEAKKLDLVSRMVMLNCESFAEKFLIPAFIFFFAMLYPFRRVNDSNSKTAAAAGGVMLIRRTMLDKIGGLASIQSALIDDCSLATKIKKTGGKIELSLTEEIHSLRPHPHIKDVWKMVARTAYTQLRHSPVLLIATLVGMGLLYLLPPLLFLCEPTGIAALAGLSIWALMTLLYLPMIKFYGIPRAWALTLPMAALVYVAATCDSARLYHQGKGGQWKGRAQA